MEEASGGTGTQTELGDVAGLWGGWQQRQTRRGTQTSPSTENTREVGTSGQGATDEITAQPSLAKAERSAAGHAEGNGALILVLAPGCSDALPHSAVAAPRHWVMFQLTEDFPEPDAPPTSRTDVEIRLQALRAGKLNVAAGYSSVSDKSNEFVLILLSC